MSRINPKQAGAAGAAAAALLAACMAYTGSKEGFRTRAYYDSVHIATACYGETKDIRIGMTFTKAQCDAMFAKRLDKDFAARVEACVPSARDPAKVSAKTYVAMVSLAYNIGTGGFCKSSVARLWNAGDRAGACHAFRRFNRAGGRVLRGLDNRRRDEERLCLRGL